jgi:hemerythrin-like metal-binding protein
MATTLAWTDKFSVGVKGIDRQHQELLARVNALFDAIGSRDSGRNVEELLGFMEKYVHRHFLCEEKLMRWHAYPGYAQHLGQHQNFVNELARIEKVYDRNGLTGNVVASMAEFISHWLSDHFLTEDRKLAEFLRAGRANLHPTTPATVSTTAA